MDQLPREPKDKGHSQASVTKEGPVSPSRTYVSFFLPGLGYPRCPIGFVLKVEVRFKDPCISHSVMFDSS